MNKPTKEEIIKALRKAIEEDDEIAIAFYSGMLAYLLW